MEKFLGFFSLSDGKQGVNQRPIHTLDAGQKHLQNGIKLAQL